MALFKLPLFYLRLLTRLDLTERVLSSIGAYCCTYCDVQLDFQCVQVIKDKVLLLGVYAKIKRSIHLFLLILLTVTVGCVCVSLQS